MDKGIDKYSPREQTKGRIKGILEEYVRGVKEKLTLDLVIRTIEMELKTPFLSIEDAREMLTDLDTSPSYDWNITHNPEQRGKIVKLKKYFGF